MHLRLFSYLPLLGLILAANFADAQTYRPNGIIPGSGVDVEFSFFYENIPLRGFAPMRVTVTNNSGRDRVWIYSCISGGLGEHQTVQFDCELAVPDGESKRFDLLVPLAQVSDHPRVTARLSGFGIRSGKGEVPIPGGGYRPATSSSAVAMSSFLAHRNLRLIGEAMGSHSAFNATAFELRLMPTNWRGFAGFESVWLADTEWERIGGAEKIALLEWIAAGGVLYLCREPEDNTPLDKLSGLRPDNPLDIGFGTVRVWDRQGDALNAARVAAEINTPMTHVQLASHYQHANWQPLDNLPPVLMRSGLLLSFLVIFALIVGPVNLYVFARGTRRYRLFWTTPALSLGASAFIFLLILLQDGVGGQGYQLAIWAHLPAENKAAVVQEQVARASLLTSHRFSTKEAVAISTIGTGMASHGKLLAGTRQFSGDYFRNRAIQGHLLESVPATRWRIEAAPTDTGSPPRLLSTFPFELAPVFFIDEDGQHWQIDRLGPGTAQPFHPVPRRRLANRISDVRASAGPVGERRLDAVLDRPGHFYAFAQNAPGATEKTLGSIQWESQSVHTGPVYFSQP